MPSPETASHPGTKRPWKTWPATSSGHPSPRNGCGIWIRRRRLSIIPRPAQDTDPGTAKRQRYFPPWNGWRPCVPTSRTKASRWCVITDTTATSPGENATERVKRFLTRAPDTIHLPDDRQIRQYSAAKNGLTLKILPHILSLR